MVLARLRSAASVTAALALVLALSACGGGGQQQPRDTLRMAAAASGPFTREFNPLLQASDVASGYSVRAIYDPLMLSDHSAGGTKPWLATKATWNSDGTKLTIELRPGVKWSDGTDFTAQDVAFTFQLMLEHKALNLSDLPLQSATATSSTQAVVTFTKPAFQTLWYTVEVVQEKQWSQVQDPVTYTNPNPIGTGPYTLKSFTPGVITLSKNAHFWQTGAPKIGTVEYLSYDSESSMDAAFEGGQVDWIVGANTDPKQLTSTSPSALSSWSTPYGASIYLLPNTSSGPTADVAVRKAINEAVNRPELAQLSFAPDTTPLENATGLDSTQAPIAAEYQNQTLGSGSAANAKATLEAAGYKLGADGYFVSPQNAPLSMTFLVPTSTSYGDWVRTASLMTSELKSAGIRLTTKTESVDSWRKDTGLGNFQMTIRAAGGAGSVYDNLNRLLSQPVKPVGTNVLVNWERYASTKAGALLSQMAGAATGSAQYTNALYGLENLLVDDVPVIALGSPGLTGIWRSSSFSGWPSAQDPYALPTGARPEVGEVLSKVTPMS